MTIFSRFKQSILPIFAFFLAAMITCCTGGSGPGSSSVGPMDPGSQPLATNPNNLANQANPIGYQPTDQGWGTENPAMVLLYVTRPDGAVSISNDMEDKVQACTTSKGPLLLFPGDEKPIIYGALPFLKGFPTNACGQSWSFCPNYKDPKEGHSSIEVYSEYNDNGSIYASDKRTIDCTKLDGKPVVLTLKPSFSETSSQTPSNSESDSTSQSLYQ